MPTPCPLSWSPQSAAGRRRREGLRGSRWPGRLSPAGEAAFVPPRGSQRTPALAGKSATPQRYEGCWLFSLGASPGEPVLWGAPLGRCPGPWFWEPRQPRKPGSDQSWVRPLLGAGTPRLPRFALDLAVLNLHLLPPHGTRWAGAAPVGGRGDPPNSKTALPQPRLSGQEGPSCVHMCLRACGHYPRCSGRPSAAGSRPMLKHAGVCSVSPPGRVCSLSDAEKRSR